MAIIEPIFTKFILLSLLQEYTQKQDLGTSLNRDIIQKL
jgi:hypothetical protein